MKQSFSRVAVALFAIILMGQGCTSGNKDATSAGPAGIFVSTDKGESWQSISLLPRADGIQSLSGLSVYRIFEDPLDPRTMYWASREKGLFITYNDGRDWFQPEGPVSQGFMYGVAVHPTDKCTVYVTNGSSLYITTDCSRTWSELYTIPDSDRINSVAINTGAPHEVLMARRSGDIMRSNDGGISWSIIRNMNTTAIDLYADPLVKNRFYLGTSSNGLYRSDDIGDSWTAMNNGIAEFSGANEYRRLTFHQTKPGTLYYISTFGIHISTDGGDTWVGPRLIHAPGSAKIYGFSVNPTNDNEMYYVATIDDRSSFYKSVDGGKNWITKRLPSNQIPTFLRAHPTQEGWLYLGFTIPPKEN